MKQPYNTFKMQSTLTLVTVLLVCATQVMAQTEFGLLNSNYGGVYTLKINPANICYQPVSLDINIMGASGYVGNNQFYSKPMFVLPTVLGGNNVQLVTNGRNYNGENLKPGQILINQDLKSTGYLFGGIDISGPSFMMLLSTHKAVALTTAYRSMVSGTNISDFAASAFFDGINNNYVSGKFFDVHNTKLAFASWFETGLSFASVVGENSRYVSRLGVSLKALFATNGGYAYDNGFRAHNGSSKTIDLRGASFNYAYSGPDSKGEGNSSYQMRGFGAAADIGYSIQQKERSRKRRNYCPNLFGFTDVSCEYKWKAGISLLDLGAIKFYNNALTTQVNGATFKWEKWDTLFKYNVVDADQLVKENVAKGTGTVSSSDAFWMIMPSAISAQFDYKFIENVYLNATLIQRVSVAQAPWLARMNVAAISPRFETENIEISLPVSFIEYTTPVAGVSFRYKYICAGTNRLGETFGLQRAYGADFYVSLRYTISERCKKMRKYF